MISLPNEHEPCDKLQFTGSFYFRCEDADAMWNRLIGKIVVVYPIENFDYGMR